MEDCSAWCPMGSRLTAMESTWHNIHVSLHINLEYGPKKQNGYIVVG